MMLRFLFLVIYTSNVIFNGKFILFCGFRCHTRLFGKAGMYHFLCSGCHDSESEVSRTRYFVIVIVNKIKLTRCNLDFKCQ